MKEYVLITGASSGIGKALAYVFAEHGEDLVLIARREELLHSIAEELMSRYQIHVIVYPADLQKEDAVKRIYAFCKINNISVKTLINNAGIGAQGNFTDISLEKQKQIISLNVSVVMEMCHYFMRDMKERRSGTIVNISSTTAFMPLANEAVYAAAKAFILSFSQALYEEMKPFGVSVCTICPGVTNTEFFQSADFRLDHFHGADPDAFARFAYQKIQEKRPLSVHRFSNRVVSVWARLMPRSAVRRISAKFG